MTHRRLYQIVAPRDESGTAPEQFFVAFHGRLRRFTQKLQERGQPRLSLEIGGSAGAVRFFVYVPHIEEQFVLDQLHASYPGAEIHPVPDDPLAEPKRGAVAVGAFRLRADACFPIETSSSDRADILDPLLEVLKDAKSPEQRIHVQMLVQPLNSKWHARARQKAEELRKGGPPRPLLIKELFPHHPVRPTMHQAELARAIYAKAAYLGFNVALRVYAVGRTAAEAQTFLQEVRAALRVFYGLNSLTLRRTTNIKKLTDCIRAREPMPGKQLLLTTPELAALWHLPEQPRAHVEALEVRNLPPPPGVRNPQRVIGVSTFPGQEDPVGLSVEDSRRHLHVVGPTGTGKSTLLLNLILQDIRAGRGVGVIDPKGDLVSDILSRMPQERIDDVVFLGPEEDGVTLGINPLEWDDIEERDLHAENILAIFRRIFAEGWGPRTDDILRSSLFTLMRRKDSTLCYIPALLLDPYFRARYTENIDDPVGLGSFWDWYESIGQNERMHSVGAPLNKMRELLARPKVRHLLCHTRSTFDLERIINGKGILLAKLSSGLWGEQSASLIGSFLFAKLWQVVKRRVAIPEAQREDFMLYVDEFAEFLGVAGSFADTLAQARSYRLCLTLSHQHMGQLPRSVVEAVDSNARSRVVFQCGQEDARYFAREMHAVDAHALQSLPRYHAIARLSVNGQTSPAFTILTAPPPPVAGKTLNRIITERSRELYGKPVKDVDAELQTALGAGSLQKPGRRVKT